MAAVTTVLIYLTAVVAVVMMWRGLWGLLDEYVWPKNPRRSYWSTFILGFILIVIVLTRV
jgi:succinate dehydrogenase hydrophobic anchor subunit